MLDRLDDFRSYVMIDLQTLVGAYYAFCKWPDISSYVADLLYKNKFLYDNIENVSNKRPYYGKGCLWVNKTIYIYRFEGNF